jgi:hypothetical protein
MSIGCASTGLSSREVPGQSQSTYIRALYDAPLPTGHAGADSHATAPAAPRPFQGPAKLAVAQVGEVAPPEPLLKGLRGHPQQFSRVEPVPALPEGYEYSRGGPVRPTATDHARRHIDTLCDIAISMNMDYLLLVGGTIDHDTNATPLSILNLTIIGAFVIPSDQTRAHVKATGALIDLKTRQVVSISSAEVKGDHLTPAVSTNAERVPLFKRLGDKAAAQLAEQVAADCQTDHREPVVLGPKGE